MADATCAAPVVDICKHFPKKKLHKQSQEEGGNGCIFSKVEEFPQELHLEACDPKELWGDFGGDGGYSGDNLSEEEKRLAMIMSLIVNETRDSAVDLIALQSKNSFLLFSPFAFIFSLTNFLM